jgi:CheY-like chemotaxis protein
VAEDNSANQELIKIILESYGLHYFIASDGQEAVMRFKSGNFDLVLMDEQMPKKSGTQATEEIRAYEIKREKEPTPIVVLTANVLKGERERSLEKGFNAFLGKPIVLKEIEGVFSRFLEPVFEADKSQKHLQHNKVSTLKGVNAAALASELMLEEEQVLRLMKIYTNKMYESLDELKGAIALREYKVIGHLAHSIKGSSSNFRIEKIVEMAYELEKASYAKESGFDFESVYDAMVETFNQIALDE